MRRARSCLNPPEREHFLDARSLVRAAWWMSGAHMTAQFAAYASLLVVAGRGTGTA